MLTYAEIRELVEVLENCGTVRDAQVRQTIILMLPPEWTGTLPEAPTLRSHLTNVVLKCSQFPQGIETLIKCVRFQEGDTTALKEVERVWEKLSTPTTEEVVVEVPPPSDPDTKLASEYHWNRDEVVKVFVGMIKQDPSYAPWRLLVVRGPSEAGLSTFVERLEFICKEIGKRDSLPRALLHARVRLRTSTIRPDLLANQILTVLGKNADECVADMRRSKPSALPQYEMNYLALRERIDKTVRIIDERWGVTRERGSSAPSVHELGDVLTDCLRQSERQCTIVLLFQDYDQVASLESGKWLLDIWLQRHIVNLEGLVMVIAGASGLDGLERRDKWTHCPKTIPALSLDQLYEWARVGWGLTDLKKSDVEEANEECNGNPAEFLVYLHAWSLHAAKPRPSCYQQIKRGRPS